MSGVPYVFGNATTSIPLSQLDVNFATNATLGNATVGLGNTTTTVGNLTLTNATISGLSGGSANGVVYINSSNVAVSNPSVLDFDGANLGLGVTPSASYAGYKTFQIASQGVISADTVSNGALEISNNSYRNSAATPTYINSFAATLYTQYQGQHRWFNAPSGTAGANATFTQAMTLDASGNLLIGGTTQYGSAKITISNGGAYLALNSTTGGYSLIRGFDSGTERWSVGQIGFGGTDGMAFYTGASNTERARIDSSGNLLVGTTSTYGPARVNVSFNGISAGGVGIQNSNTGNAGGFVTFFNSANTQIASISQATATTVLYNTTSDYRLKTVIGAVTGAGERIDALEPIEYTWKADGSRTRGFLAHKFQEVYAGSVTGNKDAVDAEGNPEYQAMQAGSAEVIADLVAEIQSLRKRLAAAGIA